MTGFELRLCRRGFDWSQERAAEELGISVRSYITYENHQPPRLIALAALALEKKVNGNSDTDFLKWRQEHKLTQTNAAKMLGVSLRCYIDYEKIKAPYFARLAIHALKIS